MKALFDNWRCLYETEKNDRCAAAFDTPDSMRRKRGERPTGAGTTPADASQITGDENTETEKGETGNAGPGNMETGSKEPENNRELFDFVMVKWVTT